MEDSKLFKNIWRFNAVLIALAGLAAIAALCLIAFMVVKEITHSRHRQDIVNIDPQSNTKETFRLGRITTIKGSQSIILPLYSDQSFDLSIASKKSTVSTRNLLFSNIRNDSNQWLLPNNRYLISDYQLIRIGSAYDQESPVVTIFYKIVKADTNSDTRLTQNDEVTIAFSSPEGDQYTEVLFNIESVLGHKLIDSHTMAVIFNRKGKGNIAYIDLNNFAVIKETALPQIPQ